MKYCSNRTILQMTDNQSHSADKVIPQVSWSTTYIDPHGFICSLSLQSSSGKDLIQKAEQTINYLKSRGCKPIDTSNQDSHNDVNNAEKNNDPSWCPIHCVKMKKRHNDHGFWYSHRLEGGGWCKGRT